MTWQFLLGQCAIILVDSEPSQTLIVDVDAPWVHWCDHHIQAQVELESIDQEWIRNVLRNDTLLIDRHLRNITDL